MGTVPHIYAALTFRPFPWGASTALFTGSTMAAKNTVIRLLHQCLYWRCLPMNVCISIELHVSIIMLPVVKIVEWIRFSFHYRTDATLQVKPWPQKQSLQWNCQMYILFFVSVLFLPQQNPPKPSFILIFPNKFDQYVMWGGKKALSLQFGHHKYLHS